MEATFRHSQDFAAFVLKHLEMPRNSPTNVFSQQLGLQTLEQAEIKGEPHHITLQIDVIKHFNAGPLEILHRKAFNVIFLDPDKHMEVNNSFENLMFCEYFNFKA